MAHDYTQRYRDIGYLAIRGREQQLPDHFGMKEAIKAGTADEFSGGAWTDTNPGPHLTENRERPVSKENPFGLLFHETAEKYFMTAVPPFTGYKAGDLVQQ